MSRFNKNEIELLRMCNKLNTNVIGGFSKLMKHQPYNVVISYIDRSKFNGIGYIKTGFSIIKDSGLSYSYYKGPIKLNRIGAQKHKLQTLLGDMYDPEKNEYENMMLNGWLQVYDCGNLKVQYIKN